MIGKSHEEALWFPETPVRALCASRDDQPNALRAAAMFPRFDPRKRPQAAAQILFLFAIAGAGAD
jgi:hypothetical protein